MKNTKRALLTSVIALVMCITMLVGTTFAWFTDSVVSANNKIVAGELDVELYMHTETGKVRISTEESPIFGKEGSLIAKNENADTLWEPGKTQVAYLEIANEGNLALKYQVAIEVRNDKNDLYEVMEYAIVPDAKVTDAKIDVWADLADADTKPVVVGTNVDTTDVVLEKGASHYFALAVHMLEEAGNKYQNGEVSFDIKVLATQATVEADYYDETYDKDATYAITVSDAATLADAMATSGNVVLGADVASDTQVIVAANDSTLDLAGNELSVYKLTGEGNTTISDGTLVLPANGYVYSGDGANVTVENVEIDSDDLSVYAYTGGTINLKNVTLTSTSVSNPVQNYGGTLVLDNVTAAQEGDAASAWYSSAIQVINRIVQLDEKIDGKSYETISQAKTTINSGNYTGKRTVMISAPGGDVTINGGTFVGTEAVIQNDFKPTSYHNGTNFTSVVTINGGDFTGTIKGSKAAKIHINGGNFNGTFSVKAETELVIKGGTFTVDPSAYLAEGFIATENAGVWTVTAE